MPIEQASLPADALLARYAGTGNYVDCLTIAVPNAVTLSEWIAAFYSSPAFRPERWLLAHLLGKPSTAQDIADLAAGQSTRFAAWTVEQRTADQLLLCDFQQATRSWLMVEPLTASNSTRLYFGTAVVLSPRDGRRFGVRRALFWGLLWFHKAYARLLLGSGANRLAAVRRA